MHTLTSGAAALATVQAVNPTPDPGDGTGIAINLAIAFAAAIVTRIVNRVFDIPVSIERTAGGFKVTFKKTI